jgi:hypothetical protein
MQVPISILHHEGYALLDGRNRLDALETVGLDVAALLQAAMNWEEIAELKVIYVQPPTGSNSVIASRKADPYDYVVSVNERRRHLTTAQRSEIAAKLLKARPDLSDRAIAKTAQLDHTTVASKRRKLEAGGEIHHPTKRTGRDGKAQSATKTKARASPDTTALADPPASPEPEPPISEPLPSDPSPSANAWPVEAERTSRLPDHVPLAQPICWRGTKPPSGTLPSARPQSTTPAALPPKRSKAASITPPLNTPPSSTPPRFNRRLRARRLTTSRQESPMNSSRPRRTM